MAITGHETIVESLRKGRDLGLKKTPQGPPPPPPSSGDVALLDDALVAETRPVHVPSIRPGTSVLRKATMLQSIGYSLVGLFVVSCAGLFLASTSACSPQQWDDAADTAIEVARESACVENYLEHSADPTFEGGAVLCTGASLSLFQQIVQDFKDAHAAPIVDAGVMRVTGPSALEIGLVRLHHAEAGAQ